MTRIIISYRRDDSLDMTGRIFDRLAGHFGREAIFRDIDNIPPGADFRRHIDGVLDESDIVLAIVGPRWIGPGDQQLRLASAADPVRLEIETALRKKKPLIPVLVSRAVMPNPDALPDSLHDFAYRNAVQIDSGQDFDVHVGRLIRGMERILGLGEKPEVDEAGQGAEAALRIEPTPTVASPVDPVAPVSSPFRVNGGHTVRRAIGLKLVVMLVVIGAGGVWWVFVERPHIATWTISWPLKGPEVSTLGNQSPGVISGGDATINFGSSPAAQSGSPPAKAPNLPAPTGTVRTEGAQSPAVVAGGKVGIEFAPTPSAPR